MESLSDYAPYRNLANAIVKNAVKEYKRALKKIIKDPWDEKAWYQKIENERFFKSNWYSFLTNVRSECLIQSIKEEVGYID